MSTTSNAAFAREALSGQTWGRTFSDGLGGIVRRLWHAYWSHQAKRATALMLQALDDRALADIGFRRNEIDSVVFGQPSDRRRPYKLDWRHRAVP